jgi:YHS domain-containing protein
MHVLFLLACSTPAPDAPAPAASPSPASVAVLAKADAHDGEVDQIVHQCTGCGLGMDGDAAHAVQHAGYELHFCSATCKAGFEKDPAAGVKRLDQVLTH